MVAFLCMTALHTPFQYENNKTDYNTRKQYMYRGGKFSKNLTVLTKIRGIVKQEMFVNRQCEKLLCFPKWQIKG